MLRCLNLLIYFLILTMILTDTNLVVVNPDIYLIYDVDNDDCKIPIADNADNDNDYDGYDNNYDCVDGGDDDGDGDD